MSLRFILGNHGTGKTKLCLSEIIEKQNADNTSGTGNISNNLIYIVPEQFSLQSEKSLLKESGGKGLMRAQVLSFQRLAYMIFAESGGVSHKNLEDIGKNMLLRKILMELPDLKYFSKAADKQGFLERLSVIITEFYQYSIEPETLLQTAESLETNENLKFKLEDLYRIFNAYRNYVSENYISNDDALDILARKIETSDLIKGAEIWVDGFRSFTPQELAVISKLLTTAENVSITLCADADSMSNNFRPEISHPFYEGALMVSKLNAVSAETGIKVLPPVLQKENVRLSEFPELAYIKNNFFEYNVKGFEGDSKNVKIYYAENIYREIHNTASEIIRLAREEKYLFREIGVICSSIEEYEKIVNAVFPQYNIPVFIDARKDMLSHPLAELLRSAAEIAGRGYQYENVFRFLRTGLTGIPREEIDVLENYVLAYGINSSKRWLSDWEYGFEPPSAFDRERLNGLRSEVLLILLPFTEKFGRNKKYPAAEICKALYELMEKSNAGSVLTKWMEEMRLSGNNEVYDCHSQAWGKTVKILDKIYEILGHEELRVSEFGKILEAGFAATDLGLAPPSLDGITVGDFRRSRLPEIKALFALGINEGKIPGKYSDDGILSEEERKQARSLSLAPSAIEKGYEERRLIYANLLKPSKLLVISCFLNGLDGKSFLPSQIIDKIVEMLPNAEQINLARNQDELFDFGSAAQAFSNFSKVLRNYADNDEFSAVYKDAYSYFAKRPEYTKKLEVIKGIVRGGKEDALSKQSVKKLYQDKIQASVSKLEKYIQCPFGYFMQYNLKASERRIYSVENVDLGNVFHESLDNFANMLKAENLGWAEADDSKIREMAYKSVDDAINSSGNEIFKSSGRYRYFADRVKEISYASINALTEHMRRGKFKLAFSEASFSDGYFSDTSSSDALSDCDLDAIEIPLSSGVMELEGKIDRVDFFDSNGDRYVKIIDYKSGANKFCFDEVYYGLQLQLLLYIRSFIEKYRAKTGHNFKGEILPAAVLYFHLINPLLDFNKDYAQDDELLKNDILKQFKMSGVTLNESDIVYAMDQEPGSKSDIIPVGLLKGSTPENPRYSKNSLLLSGEGFGKMMEYTLKKAEETGERILNGDISISPFKYKDRTGCDYCTYNAVCGFDSGENLYNRLGSKSDEEALNEITGNR